MDDFWSILSKRIAERYEEELLNMSKGHLKDHGDYRFKCGYLEGLRFVQEEARALIKQITGDK